MPRDKKNNGSLSCPIPITEHDVVTLAHGSGGTLSSKLIDKILIPLFDNKYINQKHDSAIINLNNKKIAFTTDSYVIQPIFFPGGNIGELAVYGTVNDLVAAGATPKFISLSFIIEEGLSMKDFWEIVHSIKVAAKKAKVLVVTGDTKVVDKGKGDKLFINTSGIGVIENGFDVSPLKCKPGDKIILSGAIAEHGIAILTVRKGFEFETEIKSDLSPLNDFLRSIKNYASDVHVMRDPTRGGLASSLNEIAKQAGVGMLIYENKIPIRDDVNAACEILGIDPLYVANEGKMIFILAQKSADKILGLIRKNRFGKDAQIIGEVVSELAGTVVMKTKVGSKRIVDMISGEQLPRIC